MYYKQLEAVKYQCLGICTWLKDFFKKRFIYSLWRKQNICIYSTPPPWQHVTQGQFLSRVNLVSVQSFPLPRLVEHFIARPHHKCEGQKKKFQLPLGHITGCLLLQRKELGTRSSGLTKNHPAKALCQDCPVGCRCRIHQLLLCRGVRHPLP